MKEYKFAPLGVLLLLLAITSGCSKLRSRDQLNKGVAAYRNAQFQSAIMHFKNAVGLDPTLLNARLYLATAYEQQYIPGGESPDNVKLGQQAIDAFGDVLKMDPNNTTALASIGQTYYSMKNFEKAKEYDRRWLQVEPNNPFPYYWIGLLDWAICFPHTQQVRKDLKIEFPKDPNNPDSLPPLPEKARAQLEEENGPLVNEGLEVLQKAIELKPNDFGAMSYLNLMYRQKADLESTASARQADLKEADDWVNKALAAKKAETTAATTAAQ
jgi:tetratricopeptide (TPR) repeat protein